jgi:hypothetical protein
MFWFSPQSNESEYPDMREFTCIRSWRLDEYTNVVANMIDDIWSSNYFCYIIIPYKLSCKSR